MEAINNWINCILATVVLAGIVEAIIPEGDTKKFVLLVTGVIVSIVIASPILKAISKDFSIDGVFKVDNMEDSFYYIDTLRGTVERQNEVLEEVFAGNVVEKFNSMYAEMKIRDCKITFSHDEDGKIIEIKEVFVHTEKSVDDKKLLVKRISEICEVEEKKVRVG